MIFVFLFPLTSGIIPSEKYSPQEANYKRLSCVVPNRSFFIYFIKKFFFCLFMAAPMAYGISQATGRIGAIVPRLKGSNRSCSRRPTPQPQPCQIRAASVTHSTAHSNAGSLTHCMRPGIEPKASWILVGFLTAEPQWERLFFYENVFFKLY